MKVLGIETSCDETGVAIYDSEKGLLAHALYSQIPLHAPLGGVIPELASRDHIQKTLPLIQRVLEEAKLNKKDLKGIAYTAGPGLAGALLVGAALGRSLGFGFGIPTIAIHHMEGHLLAPLLENGPPSFPFVALLVSGGHTLLVKVLGVGNYHILGESLDDAAGEAFDKTARLLGLSYPGGALLASLAKKGRARFKFPRPMLDRPGLDFSFSGLKTHVSNIWMKSEQDDQTRADIAYAFQEAVVETLVEKCFRALKETNLKSLVIAGGVSANSLLRERLSHLMNEINGKVYFPRMEFCTDNGAMIAFAGYLRLKLGQQDDLGFGIKARWPMTELTSA